MVNGRETTTKKFFYVKTVNVTKFIKSIKVSKWLMSHISKKDSKQQIKSSDNLLSKPSKTLAKDEWTWLFHLSFT